MSPDDLLTWLYDHPDEMVAVDTETAPTGSEGTGLDVHELCRREHGP
jgi:hypothetical protein